MTEPKCPRCGGEMYQYIKIVEPRRHDPIEKHDASMLRCRKCHRSYEYRWSLRLSEKI